ncbi:MFS family permease [Alkalibacillus flavidus]|uniref:MFS family permease n=1 Tax=Alkalibacillus flavidus TaxID=546021 RepID=A0ABV2KTW7_9BACI
MKFLYVVVIVAFIDTFIQLPIMTPFALSLGASEALTGLIVAMYSLSNVIGNIIGGHWVDRIGRKRMMVIGMLLVSVMLSFYPFAQTGEQLLWIRFFHGLAGGVLVPAAFALLGDLAKRNDNPKMMAFAGGAIGVAAIAGPAIGGALAAAGQIVYVFVFVAIVFVVTAVISISLIPASYVSQVKDDMTWTVMKSIMTNRGVLQASTVAFTLMLSNGTLAFALPISVENLQLDSMTTGLLLSLYGVTALVIFMSKINDIYTRYTAYHLVVIGLGLIALSMSLLQVAFHLVLMVVAMIVYGIGFAFIFPSMNQMIANSTDETIRGKAYGIFYGFFSLGVVAGSIVSGAIQQWIGLPFIFCTVLILVNMMILFRLKSK